MRRALVTIAVSLVVLLAWVPLREMPSLLETLSKIRKACCSRPR